MIQFGFTYHKPLVLQALRYHFIARREVKLLIILVNVFAIVAAALFYFKKVRPEPFFLGSLLWGAIMLSFWFILPTLIYNKSATFQEQFIVTFSEAGVNLQSERGEVFWQYQQFSHFFQSPNFYHLYIAEKSFFIIPKQGITTEEQLAITDLLNRSIQK